MPSKTIIKNAKIYAENEIIEHGYLVIENGKISSIEAGEYVGESEDVQIIDGSGKSLIPGFIDGHIHGANNADVMDGTEEALHTMADFLPKEGTTSFLATTMTQSDENIEKALASIAVYENKAGQAEILGAHLEGPFVNIDKKGAQPGEYVTPPNLETFHRWQKIADGKIKTITMAPECDPLQGEFSQTLAKEGVNVSAGHTASNYAEIKQAQADGIQQLTHLCNAMEGVHHRDIGAVGAFMLLPGLKAELIADNIHVSKEMMQLVYNNVGSEKLILITDSMRAKGLPPGEYELGGQPVHVSEDRATLVEGNSLAGSILKMVDGAKHLLALEGVTLKDIVKMASENPAKQINVFDRKGSIALGKDADILLIDEELNIEYTLCKGVIAFEGGAK